MSKIFNKLIKVGLVIALAVGVTACGIDADNSSVSGTGVTTSEAGEYEKVRIGAVGQSNILSESAAVAQLNGYLEEELNKEGYTAEIIGFAQAGPAINEAFAANEIDLAVYGDMPATVGKSNGNNTTIFATENSECQMCIFVQNDSDIKSAKDFVGRRVIVARGTIYHQYFKTLIAEAGVAESDLEQINTFADAASVMASKEADALITSTSIGYYLEAQGLGKVIETTADHVEWTSQFFAVGNTDYLKAHPEVAKAFIRSLIRAQEFIKNNPAEAYEVIARATDGYTAEIYEKIYAYDTSFDYFSPEINEDGIKKLKELEQFLEDEQLISTPVDIEAFVDTSYYDEVIAEK